MTRCPGVDAFREKRCGALQRVVSLNEMNVRYLYSSYALQMSLAVIAVSVLAFALFANTLNNPFMWDDHDLIEKKKKSFCIFPGGENEET